MEHPERYRLDREILSTSNAHTADGGAGGDKSKSQKAPNKYRNKNRNNQ